MAHVDRRPGRRLLAGVVVAGVAVVAVVGGLAALGRPSAVEQSRHDAAPQLTAHQVQDAVAAAHWARHRFGDTYDDPVIGATAIERDGIVTQSNTGHPCTSGRIVEVSVYGSFSHIATGGRFSPNGESHQDDGVTTVIITLDPSTGRRCLIGVATGSPSADPGAQLLFGNVP